MHIATRKKLRGDTRGKLKSSSLILRPAAKIMQKYVVPELQKKKTN